MKNKFHYLFIGIMMLVAINVQAQPIIADHTIVDQYANIPDEYITKVKAMLLNIAGESHSRGYRYGLALLAAQDSKFAVSKDMDDDPESPTDAHLRVTGTIRYPNGNWHNFVGEEDLWTTPWAVNNFVNTIKYMDETANNPISAMGFGWCYDMYNNGFAGSADPVYGCRWQGRSAYWISSDGSGNPSFSDNDTGWLQWGLDNADSVSLGGQRVTMDMYIRAVEAAREASSKTVAFFTTGPVDWKNTDYETGHEGVYQGFVKHEHLRAYVRNSSNGVLFDYADILCWSNSGVQRTETWEGHTYQKIHLDYLSPEYDGGDGGCHINEAACLRLGKAMWWMLARIAGWGGVVSVNDKEIQNNNYKVYPNPTQGKLTISSNNSSPVDIKLVDLTGRVVAEQHISSWPADVRLNNTTSNSYILTINDGKSVSTSKVLYIK